MFYKRGVKCVLIYKKNVDQDDFPDDSFLFFKLIILKLLRGKNCDQIFFEIFFSIQKL